MIYINDLDMRKLGIEWVKTIDQIEKSVWCLQHKEYAQPIKPYLRYRDLTNRIIAMPAFVGEDIDMAGIKWIASFPNNINMGIPRAHSIVILNNSKTGEPIGIINTALLSIVRTASVTGLFLKKYCEVRSLSNIKIAIIGWGPIGQHHFKMCSQILNNKIGQISLFDIRKINEKDIVSNHKVAVAESWEDAYTNADIVITCTASKNQYIDKAPKKGTLLLNISLRDYKTQVYEYVKDGIIVDDWEEVCREKTDIEILHKEEGLQKEHTRSIVDVVCENALEKYASDQTIMFNPMGMAVFDIAMGVYYYNLAKKYDVGTKLI